MKKIAIYGKGGIGKSTTTANVAAAMAKSGLRVVQVGCDPKADSTLLHGAPQSETVLELLRAGRDVPLDQIVREGRDGVFCVECGGPIPGTGCAGRGIVTAFDYLREKDMERVYRPDVILYDVLGDVVCGGFTMPMRAGYADKVFIITSGENMAIHAAANIAMAVENFRDRGYAQLGGLILNRRDVRDERAKVEELASDVHTRIVGELSRSNTVQEAEALGKTVMEAFPQSEMAGEYRRLASAVMAACGQEVSLC